MKIKDLDVDVSVIYKPTNKNIYFKYKDNQLIITLNTKRLCNNYESVIKKNEDQIYNFIVKSKNKIENEKSDSIHLFGKEYKLVIKKDFNYSVIVNKNTIEIHTNINTKRQIKSIIYNFYYEELKSYINEIFERAIEDFSDVKRLYPSNDIPRLEYKLAKTFFGKCYPKRNLIVLNVILAKYDKLYIKSVLYHEFCHFTYLNHQEGFYMLYDYKFPDAKRIQHNLRQIKYNDLY